MPFFVCQKKVNHFSDGIFGPFLLHIKNAGWNLHQKTATLSDDLRGRNFQSETSTETDLDTREKKLPEHVEENFTLDQIQTLKENKDLTDCDVKNQSLPIIDIQSVINNHIETQLSSEVGQSALNFTNILWAAFWQFPVGKIIQP